MFWRLLFKSFGGLWFCWMLFVNTSTLFTANGRLILIKLTNKQINATFVNLRGAFSRFILCNLCCSYYQLIGLSITLGILCEHGKRCLTTFSQNLTIVKKKTDPSNVQTFPPRAPLCSVITKLFVFLISSDIFVMFGRITIVLFASSLW